MSTLIFNGITKDYLVLERSWTLPAWAPIEREFLSIPGRPGAVPTEMRTGMRRFQLPIIIRSKNEVDKKRFVEDMGAWLIHEQPKPLIFSKYPDRMFYAQIEGSPDFAQMWRFGEGTINFVCADPYEYGDTNTDYFSDGLVNIYNNGTVDAAPIYEIDVLEDITHLDIVSDEAYIRIGEPAPIDEPVYERQTLVLSDTLKTLNNWSDATDIDNGYVAGTMAATQAGFTPTAFGTEISPRKWQGPSKRRSLPEPVQNFQLIATVDMLNVGKQTGMIEIYCLDVLGNTVAKIGIEDILQSVSQNQVKFQLGNLATRKVQYYQTADYKPAWNNYKGILRLFRDGNRFRPYFALVHPDGRHDWVTSSYMYVDEKNDYDAPITQVQIGIRKWPGTTEATMKVRDLKVWRLNDQQEGLPFIARAGDKIIIDTKDSRVLLNGENREDLKDFFSDYFNLRPGKTTLMIQPAEKVSGKVILTERFL